MKGNELGEVDRSQIMEGFECQARELVCDSVFDEKPLKLLNQSDIATE